MNTETETPRNATSNTISIPPKKTWFDPIAIRFFANKTDDVVTLRFGHNARSLEVIEISKATEENKNSAAIKALEGEIIEED